MIDKSFVYLFLHVCVAERHVAVVVINLSTCRPSEPESKHQSTQPINTRKSDAGGYVYSSS